MVRFKPKQFGPVFVLYNSDETVSFSISSEGPAQAYPPYEKPVLTLMASVGHCLVESMRMITQKEKMDLLAFSISVEAEKATDLPGRLQIIRCQINGAPVASPEGMDRLITQAKSICTVSNTLACEITVARSPDN